ncbi:hypothetical protein, partial [Caballeronia grimmiae]|uniref:hypothetical protein n=1 Tax=Caballeronia grimmiae TaxID=1071679 RepID=UPI0038BADC94
PKDVSCSTPLVLVVAVPCEPVFVLAAAVELAVVAALAAVAELALVVLLAADAPQRRRWRLATASATLPSLPPPQAVSASEPAPSTNAETILRRMVLGISNTS